MRMAHDFWDLICKLGYTCTYVENIQEKHFCPSHLFTPACEQLQQDEDLCTSKHDFQIYL